MNRLSLSIKTQNEIHQFQGKTSHISHKVWNSISLSYMFSFNLSNFRAVDQYEVNRGTRLGKILPNVVDFFFIRLIILEDFIRLISYNGPCVLKCKFKIFCRAKWFEKPVSLSCLTKSVFMDSGWTHVHGWPF